MIVKEIMVNYYNFNPFLGTTCINPCNKVLVLKSKNVIVRVSNKIYSEPGGDAGAEAPQHCLLVDYLPAFLRSFRRFLGVHFGQRQKVGPLLKGKKV
jgi:hypothetical protein